jgi:hypothetical protein
MPKKSNRSRSQYKVPASASTAAKTVTQEAVASAPVRTPVRTVVGSRHTAAVAISPEKYNYVPRELRYIAVVTGSMFLVLIVLYFFLR